MTLDDRTEISEQLSKKLGVSEDKVDLVDLLTASPILKFEATKNGKLIEGAREDFIRLKVRAFKEYADTARFRRIRERVLANYNAR